MNLFLAGMITENGSNKIDDLQEASNFKSGTRFDAGED